MNKYYAFFGILSVVVIIVVLVGFSLVGSPFSTRDKELDNIRHSHISSIKSDIDYHYRTKHKLPQSLKEIIDTSHYKDPQTNQEYTYIIMSPTSYKICAVFSTDTTKTSIQSDMYYVQYNHKKGYDCLKYDLIGEYTYTPTPTPKPKSIHRDGGSWCSNHGGIAKTVPYNIAKEDWESCLAWCDTQMSAKLPLCQYNADGLRNCWVNYPPGGVSGDVKMCNWIPGGPPYGAWWKGLETNRVKNTELIY